jgi:hypothetical protein
LLCAFKELDISKSIPNYKLESKTKRLDDEKFAFLVKFNMADL